MNKTMAVLIFCATGFLFQGTAQAGVEPMEIYPPADRVVQDHNAWTRGHYPRKIREFKANPLVTNDIVFIGDSITEKGGNWATRFGSAKVKNRGIAGDITAGVINRLGEIYHYRPAAVFIMIGVNDINAAGKTPEFTADNIFKIVSLIQKHTPSTKIFVQTILPISKDDVTQKIRLANTLLRQKASQKGFTLIDLHRDFAGKDRLLKKEFSADGIHLTEAGYEKWVELVKPFIPHAVAKTDSMWLRYALIDDTAYLQAYAAHCSPGSRSEAIPR